MMRSESSNSVTKLNSQEVLRTIMSEIDDSDFIVYNDLFHIIQSWNYHRLEQDLQKEDCRYYILHFIIILSDRAKLTNSSSRKIILNLYWMS